MHPDDLQKISENNLDIDTETLGMMIRLINALEPFAKETVLPEKDICKPDSAKVKFRPELGNLRKAKEVYEEVVDYLYTENIVSDKDEVGLDWP